jgi:exopolyphosphatase/guanosine-5'-triphosphate,3'-diphosphate pyrophosphatase
VLVDYRRESEQLGAERVLAVGTSAVRDADNGEAFLGEVEWSYGFTTRLLDGGEEAELVVRGVSSERSLDDGTLVVDIGGGSTELVTVNGDRIAWAISTEAGSVRLTERFLHADPPSREELETCAEHVRSLLPDVDVAQAIGVAGTVTTAAAVLLGGPPTVHGRQLTRDGVAAVLARLAEVPLHDRARVPGLAPERAPVIVAGLVTLREILDRYRLPGLDVSERDLLDGAALLAAELPEPEEGLVPPMAFTCC